MRELVEIPKFTPLPPVPSDALAIKLATFDGMEIVRREIPVRVVAEAKAHLARLEVFHAPPVPERIEMWCRELRKGVPALSDREFSVRLEAIKDASGQLPGWCWNAETLRTARQTFRFFPSSSELHELICDVAARAMKGISQVRLLAAAKPAEPDTNAVVRLPAGIVARTAAALARRGG